MPVDLEGIRFAEHSDNLDWAQIKADLAADDFDNGRSPHRLARSFEDSHSACYALDGERCVGMARLLADGVCNAYLIDVWTFTPYRRRGIASEIIRRLLRGVPGHHVLLITEGSPDLYLSLGFEPEKQTAMSRIVGTWLSGAEGDPST